LLEIFDVSDLTWDCNTLSIHGSEVGVVLQTLFSLAENSQIKEAAANDDTSPAFSSLAVNGYDIVIALGKPGSHVGKTFVNEIKRWSIVVFKRKFNEISIKFILSIVLLLAKIVHLEMP